MSQIEQKLIKAKNYLQLNNLTKEKVARTYQAAFAKPPWNEASQCASKSVEIKCVSGFSSQQVGEYCQKCQQSLINPAYSIDELLVNFEEKATNQNALFYFETDQNQEILMCAILWLSTPEDLFERKYKGNLEMKTWLEENLPLKFTYLDEIFADLDRRPTGNLRNLESIILESAKEFNSKTVVYRTIQDMLNYKMTKTFGTKFTLYKRDQDLPDRRDLGVINLIN